MHFRKVTMWENSVPSPGKSKLLSKIKVRPTVVTLTSALYIWAEWAAFLHPVLF